MRNFKLIQTVIASDIRLKSIRDIIARQSSALYFENAIRKTKLITSIVFTFGCIITAISISSCNRKPTTPEVESVSDMLPQTFQKRFKGTIGNLAVTINLTKVDSILSGNYYYDNVGLPLSLEGSIASDGFFFTLREKDDAENETGVFTGSFSDTSTISGTWTDPKTQRQLAFKLAENNEGTVSLEYREFNYKDCARADSNRYNKDELEYYDTLCSSVSVSLFTIAAPKTAATKTINDAIASLVCGSSNGELINCPLQEILKDEMGEDGQGASLNIFCDVVTNDNNILSISLGRSAYAFGAAHPYTAFTAYNYDTRTGKQIMLQDILLTGYQAKLNAIGKNIFIEAKGRDGWWLEEENFKLENDFSITPGGLLFTFDEYQIGPYAVGTPEVFIPYKAIEELIDPKGILGKWSRK